MDAGWVGVKPLGDQSEGGFGEKTRRLGFAGVW